MVAYAHRQQLEQKPEQVRSRHPRSMIAASALGGEALEAWRVSHGGPCGLCGRRLGFWPHHQHPFLQGSRASASALSSGLKHDKNMCQFH